MKRFIVLFLSTLMLLSFNSVALAEETVEIKSPNGSDVGPQVTPSSAIDDFVKSYTSQGEVPFYDENGKVVGQASAWQYDAENKNLYRTVTITDEQFTEKTRVRNLVFIRGVEEKDDGTVSYINGGHGMNSIEYNQSYEESFSSSYILWKSSDYPSYDRDSWKALSTVEDVIAVIEAHGEGVSDYADDRDGETIVGNISPWYMDEQNQTVFYYDVSVSEDYKEYAYGTSKVETRLLITRINKLVITNQGWLDNTEAGTYYIEHDDYVHNPENGDTYFYNVTYQNVQAGIYGPTLEELQAQDAASSGEEPTGDTIDTGDSAGSGNSTGTGDTTDTGSSTESGDSGDMGGTAGPGGSAESGDSTGSGDSAGTDDTTGTGDPTGSSDTIGTDDSTGSDDTSGSDDFTGGPSSAPAPVTPTVPSYSLPEEWTYPAFTIPDSTGDSAPAYYYDVPTAPADTSPSLAVRGTFPDGSVLEVDPSEVVKDVDTALAELEVSDPQTVADLTDFFTEAQKSEDILTYGVVDFGDRFLNSEDDFIMVPIYVKGLERGERVRVLLSNGTEHRLVCEQREIVWVPFPKNAHNIGYAVFRLKE